MANKKIFTPNAEKQLSRDKQYFKRCIFLVLFFGLFLFTNVSEALVIKGAFPVREGKFWNFRLENSNTITSWVVPGTLSIKDVGRVFLLQQEGDCVLAVREDWEGLRVYAEFYNDKFYIFDTPHLFLPRDIDIDPDSKPHESSARMRVFTDPSGTGNFEKTGEETRTVFFQMKGIEDVVINSIEYKDVFVIEKNTTQSKDTIKETLWLAHSIGPVKRVVQRGSHENVYTAFSYEGVAQENRTPYSVREFFPLNAGEERIYLDQKGKPVKVHFSNNEMTRLHDDIHVTPYHEPGGNILYFNFDKRGLTIPQRFWESYGGITAYTNSEDAGIFLPATVSLGSYNKSFSIPRSYNSRSLVLHDFNNPEEVYASTVLMTEDVQVPAGTFNDCLKIHLYYVISNFEIQFDALSTGFIWLAQGKGIVKEEKMYMMNTSLPESINSIFNVASLKLESIENTVLSGEKKGGGEEVSETADNKKIITVKEFEELLWKQNSRNMFNRIIEEIPFFIRPIAAPKFRKAIAQRAGRNGIVTEEIVIACAKEETLPKYVDQVLQAIEPLKTK